MAQKSIPFWKHLCTLPVAEQMSLIGGIRLSFCRRRPHATLSSNAESAEIKVGVNKSGQAIIWITGEIVPGDAEGFRSPLATQTMPENSLLT
ncbi:hypothetical protein [Bradyrhizobium sp. CCBAU 45384]|uniref:hypothetical protein n=1 Tax=Bradyrhizobium sp. CCBAU 45384 TaxID=858428 RepID=UPI0023064070|nr:hypothetical protein [Bradyrhizobium sp. CCBAU 45384]